MQNLYLQLHYIKTLKTLTLFDPCGINIREPEHQMILYNTSKKDLMFYKKIT
jgi:hypothetical protein